MRRLGIAVMVVLALVLAACTSSSAPPARHTSGLIAWISTPAPPTTSTTTTTTTLAPAAVCSKSSLEARLGSPLGGSGETVYVTNIAKTTCRLSGYATAMVVTPDGNHIPLRLRHHPQNRTDYPVVTSRPADLAPGATGGFLVGEYSCGLVQASTTTTSGPAKPEPMVVLYLPHGEGSVRYGPYVQLCPPTTPYWDSELGELIQPPLQPLSLGSTGITAPDIVRTDSVLNYSITLGDPRVQLGRLTPCPSYTEALGYAGGVHQYSFLLNCKSVELLGRHERATLAMEIRVPRVSGSRAATLTWRLDRPNSYPTLGLFLTISSNPLLGNVHMTTAGTVVIPLPGRPTTTTTTVPEPPSNQAVSGAAAPPVLAVADMGFSKSVS